MNAKDVFIGPILRRVQPDLVVVSIATFKPFSLRFSVKEEEEEDPELWLGHDNEPVSVQVSSNLYFYYGRIVPEKGEFSSNKLLAYSIGIVDEQSGSVSYKEFESLVMKDLLSYDWFPLPTFYIQHSTQQLNVLYGSCRKIHDANGGKIDALSLGDTLLSESVTNLRNRPAILCLGGDQIYADDVHDLVMAEIIKLSKKLDGDQSEELDKSTPLPGIGARSGFVRAHGITSEPKDCRNHLVLFTEYLAMYGLMWNLNNWSNTPAVKELSHFTEYLVKVRRLFANVPTYMIFDDHDITDDWNIDVKWRNRVQNDILGRRIVTNGLMAAWLCQGYGNDPSLYSKDETNNIAKTIRDRHNNGIYKAAELLFWGLNKWEFSTPTNPFVYFLDTRTQRGPRDGTNGKELEAPAYLKTQESWELTKKRLLLLLKKNSSEQLPIVLVAPGPVFAFKFLDELQMLLAEFTGPYYIDLESWAANKEHLHLFLDLMSERNVVLLSGDVHYAFTSTVKVTRFDDRSIRDESRANKSITFPKVIPVGANPSYNPLWTTKFLQLNSSALKNYASDTATQIPAQVTNPLSLDLLTEDGKHMMIEKYENNEFVCRMLGVTFKKTNTQLKPARLISQQVNNFHNSRYISDHNLGVATFKNRTVMNYFLTPSKDGKLNRINTRTWDFLNDTYWN